MKYFEIRQAFIDYFKSQNHRPVASSSLIPHNDPTLMFTNAGMNQFKDVFLGVDSRDYKRAVTIQKCLRAGGKHNDLENVGFTARHHTFFEMMGNFSFGDYFKTEAIEFAWDLLTNKLRIPEERLYVTVFETDDEAAEIWEKKMGVPKSKIFRYGEKDNFWRMGQTGPCGPCSEIFYDHNPSGPKIALHEDEARFVEIWNLVFMQYFEDETGKQTPLPKPSVDTGAGIERMAAALQGFTDNYQCDIFQPLIGKACGLAGIKNDWSFLSQNPSLLGSVKVVADHARAATFLIGEGVLPSNEGRGYVLRRIMRRAIRYARKLSQQTSIYPEVCNQVIQTMGSYYPELVDKSSFILKAVQDEEVRFLQTLDKGSDILNEAILKLKKQQSHQVSGETAFTLYDTYGFPLDLTQVIAKENNLSVDEEGFQQQMEKARAKARSARKSSGATSNEKHLGEWSQGLRESFGATQFTGYQELRTLSRILGLSDGSSAQDSLSESGWAAFSVTPFYAEGGGQAADQGLLLDETGKVLGEIIDCRKFNDIFLHELHLHHGVSLRTQGKVKLQVHSKERQATANNHSATHLLNAALKQVLGDHVNQAGSLVNDQKLRFDFNHSQPVSEAEWLTIEKLVNEQIGLGLPVSQEILPHKEAIARGAVAMFGEKYGSEVRVISMGQGAKGTAFSMELCGGTHVSNTGQIRLFKILSESGVAAGVRRIEAVTGERAFEYLNLLAEENLRLRRQFNLRLPKADDEFGLSPNSTHPLFYLTGFIDSQNQKIKKLEQDVRKAASQSVSIEDLLTDAKAMDLKGTPGKALVSRVPLTDRNLLSDLADRMREKQSPIAIVLIGESEGDGPKPLVVAVSKSLKGLHAGKITQELCSLLDGKGGGRPDFAQGSVQNLDRLNAATEKFYELLG